MGLWWDIASLMWRPRRLAEVALHSPWWAAFCAWVVGGTVVGGGVLWAMAVPDRPVVTLWGSLSATGLVTAVAVTACMATITGSVVMLARWPSWTRLDHAGTRAMLLSLMPWVPVMVLWAPLAAAAGLAGSHVAFAGGSRPAWLDSPLLAIAGSWWWLLVGLIGYLWLLRHASWRLDQLFSADATVCPACGYDLSGSPAGGVCPECGWVRGQV